MECVKTAVEGASLQSRATCRILDDPQICLKCDLNSTVMEETDDVFNDFAKMDRLTDAGHVADFSEFNDCKVSTSTPMVIRTMSTSSSSVCGSHAVTHQDSAINLSDSLGSVTTTFAEVCCIPSTSYCTNASYCASVVSSHCQDNDNYECDLLSMPLPKMFLDFDTTEQMESKSQEADSAFEDCSSLVSRSRSHFSDFADFSHSLDIIKEVDNASGSEAASPSNICNGAQTPFTPAFKMMTSRSHHVISSTPLADFIATDIKHLVDKFSPKVPSRLIGRNMGLENVDFLGQLSFLDLNEPLSLIMDNLEDEDICRFVYC